MNQAPKSPAAVVACIYRCSRVLLVLPALLALLLGFAVPATAKAAGACPNEQLRSESRESPVTKAPYSLQLPDCRAFELVSPPNTLSEPAITLRPIYAFSGSLSNSAPFAIVTSGGAIVYKSEALPPETGAVPNGRGGGVFVSERGSAGWGTTDLTPFAQTGEGLQLYDTSADGSKALISTFAALVPEDQDAFAQTGCQPNDFYVVSKTAGPVLVSRGALKRSAPPYSTSGCICGPPSGQNCVPGQGIAFNEALTAVSFRSQGALDPGVHPPYSAVPQCYTWSDGGTQTAALTDFRAVGEGEDECEQLAMTPAGRPIFLDTNNDPDQGRLFVGGGGSEFPEGVSQISGDTPGVASFDGLSPDGGTAYVTTSDHLVLGNTNPGSDIYAVGIPTTPSGAVPPSNVTCVSCAAGGEATFVALSADGSHLVFKTPTGLWSWDAQGALLARLSSDTSYSELTVSRTGEFVVVLTSEALAAADVNGTPDLYELSAGASPELLTSGASTDTDAYSAAAVSSDGQRVVYNDSPSSGAPEVVDEWDAGQASQLSPIGEQGPSVLLGTAGDDLQDVLFVASEPLVSQDLNAGTPDIYDARVDGGFTAAPAPVNNSRSANPTNLLSSPYPQNLTPPNVQPQPLPANTARAPVASKTKPKTKHKPKKRKKAKAKGKPKKRSKAKKTSKSSGKSRGGK
jgi:hypothetical protein